MIASCIFNCESKLMNVGQSIKNRVVVGLGLTGLSTMRFLKKMGLPFVAFDTRDNFLLPENLKQDFSTDDFCDSNSQISALASAEEIYLSPGIGLDDPLLKQASTQARITGDLDLFMTHVNAPVVAITGSNAKSTVTTLLGEMANATKLNVGVGGNLGEPMLDLIAPERDLYVLELSSFQLERAATFNFKVACILNISEDHLDRHGSMMQYYQVKQRVYNGAEIQVFNRDDKLTFPLVRVATKQVSFGTKVQAVDDFSIQNIDGLPAIVRRGEPLISSGELKLAGQHNLMNVMAALVIGEALGWPIELMLNTAKSFKGLPHRCEYVATIEAVTYINDSKATNVGASIAALQGLEDTTEGKIILIAGGETKAADFSGFAHEVERLGCELILLGAGAKEIYSTMNKSLDCTIVESMQAAVLLAKSHAQGGDVVLLSPACASFDMFKNYQQRGEVFKAVVEQLSTGDHVQETAL